MNEGPNTHGFLLWDYIDDLSICDRLIDLHKTSDDKHAGCMTNGHHPDKKDSTDLWLRPDNELALDYLIQLQKVTKKYVEKFPFVDFYSPWTVLDVISIQHYAPPAQAFKSWHTERPGGWKGLSRHLVFMTYLNDVNDGGETEWYHQQIKLTPKKGLTAIWPVDWTYTHRGCVSNTEHKYIVTGWYDFVPPRNSVDA